jgi:uncharacterized coiled-coil DUF342 family protein
VERAAWTDERLDDLLEAVRTGFDRTDTDIRGLRAETREARSELGAEIRDVRSELHAEIRDLRSETGAIRSDLSGQIEAVRQTVLRVGGAMFATTMVGFIGVLAAILAHSA